MIRYKGLSFVTNILSTLLYSTQVYSKLSHLLIPFIIKFSAASAATFLSSCVYYISYKLYISRIKQKYFQYSNCFPFVLHYQQQVFILVPCDIFHDMRNSHLVFNTNCIFLTLTFILIFYNCYLVLPNWHSLNFFFKKYSFMIFYKNVYIGLCMQICYVEISKKCAFPEKIFQYSQD